MKIQDFIENNLYKRSLLSYFLFPLSLKYALLQKIRRAIYSSLPSLSYRSNFKIISVGNIVAGGSGKTPVTIFLAKKLSEKGKKVAVSHRGYKGKFENICKLISDEKQVFEWAIEAGDEAFLLATKLNGIPVIAGKNRKLSIKILEKKFPELDFIILDDSFQHLRVKHDFDFVVFNENHTIGNGFVLPAGILRESLSAVKFADFIVYNGTREIPDYLRKFKKPIIRISYEISRFYDITENEIPTEVLKKGKIALLSAIGQPKSFEKTVKRAGLNFFKHFRFPDHYDYANEEIFKKIREKLEKNKIDILLTTEKDFAKLKFKKNNLPLVVAEIELKTDESYLFSTICE